jgi:hypothetical protein
MNKIIKEWVAALRSGKYKQGKNYLRRGNKFCCLGVLCELAVKAKVTEATESGMGSSIIMYGQSSSVLPAKVKKWAGLVNESGVFKFKSNETALNSLAALNDSGKSFAEIADVIESKPDGLFAKRKVKRG